MASRTATSANHLPPGQERLVTPECSTRWALRADHRVACSALVADTDEKAVEIGREYMWTVGHKQRGPREHNDPPGYQSRAAVAVKARQPSAESGSGVLTRGHTYEELREVNNIIVGSPETVTRKLTEVIERLSPGYLHIYGNEGAMQHKDVMRSIELLGQEVIPALHEIKLQPYV